MVTAVSLEAAATLGLAKLACATFRVCGAGDTVVLFADFDPAVSVGGTIP